MLLLDDETALRRAFSRILTKEGYEVMDVGDAGAALRLLHGSSFDVVVSDINLPGMDGLAFLRAVREQDLDLPVVLVTGSPALESAIKAVEQGALRYLLKPVEMNVLLSVVESAVRLRKLARLKREAVTLLGGEGRLTVDRAGLEAAFERALASLHMAYQPIVRWPQRTVFAFEALVRAAEPGLPHPGALLDAAERLERLPDLGRAIRGSVGRTYLQTPAPGSVFVNLHPRDLLDDDLYDRAAPLSRIASTVVLEITERAALDEIRDVRDRVAALRRMGYRIAVDDLGAGYAGLSTFATLAPEVVKLDMSLIRHIHLEPVKQRIVGSMLALCDEMGMMVVAEGVETVAERDALCGLGSDLLQGYLFARPGPPFPAPTW